MSAWPAPSLLRVSVFAGVKCGWEQMVSVELVTFRAPSPRVLWTAATQLTTLEHFLGVSTLSPSRPHLASVPFSSFTAQTHCHVLPTSHICVCTTVCPFPPGQTIKAPCRAPRRKQNAWPLHCQRRHFHTCCILGLRCSWDWAL